MSEWTTRHISYRILDKDSAKGLLSLTNSNQYSAAKPDKTLDVIGLVCPEPVFRTRIDVDRMVAGQILEVLADDPAAEDDIKSWIKKSGNQLILVEKQGYTFRFLIRKVNLLKIKDL